MHEGQLPIDTDLVQRLVAEQFPAYAQRFVTPFRSAGTVNAIFRLGDDLSVRLPLKPDWIGDLDREWTWLPRLAPGLTLEIPEPVGRGRPSLGYPLPWAIYRWIEGQPYADGLVDDETRAAADLAQFVSELRRAAPIEGAPVAGRRPLRELDEGTRAAIDAAATAVDRDRATAAWELALQARPWSGPPVWIHTDLLRPNLLVAGGRLRAVIDFGGAGVGDPAADVIPAWTVFGPTGRAVFRAALEVDDDTWHRARGFALHQAAVIIPYYSDTNPPMAAQAVRTVEQVLADLDAGSLP